MKRLPIVLGVLAALAACLLVAPVAVAVALLRSSSDSAGPSVAAQIFIAGLVIAIVAGAGLVAWAVTRFLVGRFGRRD